MQSIYQLDWVVIDECYIVLNSKFKFQLKLQVLGEELVQIGIQLVFLTAILLLQDKEEFFQAI